MRKLALATTIPEGAVGGALSAVETAADRAIDTIESAMGIKREKLTEKPTAPAAEPTLGTKPAPTPPVSPAPSPATTQTADSAPLPR